MRTTSTTLRTAAYAFAAFVFLTGCGTLADAVNWPAVVQCGSRAADDLFPTVSRVLLDDSGPEMSQRAQSSLEDMAREHGPSVVACLVDRIVSGWAHPMAAQTPERIDNIKRARGWQRMTGTVVEP